MKKLPLIIGAALAAVSAQCAAAESQESIAASNACVEAFSAKAWDRALTDCEKAASFGDAQSQNLVGAIYQNGWGTEVDYGKAMKFYKVAASQVHGDAIANVGYLYDMGLGVEKHADEAAFYYKRAMRYGSTTAEVNLANLMAKGEVKDDGQMGSSEDLLSKAAAKGEPTALKRLAKQLYDEGKYAEAVPVLEKAGETGDAESYYLLSKLYNEGNGVKKSPAQAFFFAKLSADLGYDDARIFVGECLRDGRGTGINYPAAIDYFSPAVAAGRTDAMVDLGMMYIEGLGCDPDFMKGMELVQRAASKNDLDALNLVGLIYAEGKYTAANPELAYESFKKAADLGDSKAMMTVANMLMEGIGVPKDVNMAVQYYKWAASKNEVRAYVALGELTYTDKYGRQDLARSATYFRKAADLGDEEAKEILMMRNFNH